MTYLDEQGRYLEAEGYPEPPITGDEAATLLGFLERQRARQVYEDFLHLRQDPALLEQEAGNEFSARVFPIPARGRKELIVSYSHALPRAGEPYVLPLRGLSEIGHARHHQDDVRGVRARELPHDEEQADDDREVRDQEVLPGVPQAHRAQGRKDLEGLSPARSTPRSASTCCAPRS